MEFNDAVLLDHHPFFFLFRYQYSKNAFARVLTCTQNRSGTGNQNRVLSLAAKLRMH